MGDRVIIYGDESFHLNAITLTQAMTNRQVTDWMLPLFWSLARRYPKCQVGEIGMRGGTSTLAFLMGVEECGGHVWSMDLDPCEPALELFREMHFDGLHTFTQADSHTTDFPEGAYFDVLFIDGDHSYEGVKADYERHVKRVKDGGIVLFHDTRSWPECGKFVKEIGGYSIDLGAGLGIIMPNGPMHLENGSNRDAWNAHQPT